ncbi:MAG: CbtA family protein [Thermoplasmata archaeon]
MSIRGTLKVGLAAGLLAGLVLGLYIMLVMGPIIDEAKAIEGGEEPVPASVTKAVAFTGGIVTGVLICIPFALVFPAVDSILPWRSVIRKAWAYGALAFIIFSLLPLLAVPGAPPGVERNLSVEERQFWYIGTMLSAFGGVLAGFGLYYFLTPKARSLWAKRVLLAVSLLIVSFLWLLPFLLKPEITAIPGDVPPELIQTFSYLTILEWVLFWSVLSTALGLLWSRLEATPESSASQIPA